MNKQFEGLLEKRVRGLVAALKLRLLLATLACLLSAPALAAFTDNGDGTVTDTTTGLMWQRCAVGQTWTGSTCSGSVTVHTWDAAVALTDSFAGHTDWRLPNLTELESLVKLGSVPTIDTTAFPNTPNDGMGNWSSTEQASNPANAWLVSFYFAGSNADGKANVHSVRLVRGGQSVGSLAVCTLTASPASITAGGSSTLTASCSPAATSYTWTGGSCAGTSTASCSVAPSATTTYTVAGVNASGTSAAASATVTVTVAQTGIPAAERQVLLDLYASTNGAGWTNKTNWNGAAGTECSWFGVTCDAAQSHVTGISLVYNNLVGTLPSLSGLTALQGFNVNWNQLTGTIPSLSGLAALQSFIVSYNQLTGSIPSLSGLTALTDFDVRANRLTGPVPATSTSLVTGNLCGNGLVSSGNFAIDAAWTTAMGNNNWLTCQTGYAPPACTLTASPASIFAGGSSTLTASCSPAATSYTWTGGTCAGNTTNTCTATPADTTTYTATGSDAAGGSSLASVTVTVTAAPQPPTCTLTASPASITADGSSTLTANCSPAATSYTWTGGSCAGTSAASCSVAPSATTTYTVAGVNTSGIGAAASATVTVAQPPTCTLTATPASITAGGSSTLTASCSPAGSAYDWMAAGTCAGNTTNTCVVTPAATTTYIVGNAYAAAVATVTVTAAPAMLTVTKSGTGSGIIASSPASIDCGATCSGSFAVGTSVTLTATPASGSYFFGWSGACSGVGSCEVEMDEALNVTATFKPAPFVATTTSTITATSATISTTVSFNPIDVGKTGSVYVTAWAPANGLTALGILAAPMSHAMSVTTTRDNPYSGGAINTRQETLAAVLAAADPNAFVLVQLTTTGWQLVQNGQLIPYASGVLGDQMSALSILNNANPSNLLGAQFCVGYGTSAAEMVASGRMMPVADIPGSTVATNGSCNVAANPYKGLWYNASESGWGMSVTQHDAINFVAMYTYDQSTQPVWYVMSNCPIVAAGSCTGDIYKVVGGKPPTAAWVALDFAQALSTAGSGTLTFSDTNNGKFDFTLNGVAGSKTIERQLFSSGTAAQAVDYSDLWWNASESGWGVALTQDVGMIFATWYTYDAAGLPVWYVASSCPLSGSSCTGDVYKVTGGMPLSASWVNLDFTKALSTVGSVTFAFSDSSTGTMSYTIDGVAGSRAIVRQAF